MDNRDWHGSPLDMMRQDMEPTGINEVVIEYDNGEADTFRAQRREEFRSYELYQMAYYLKAIVGSIKQGRER